MIHEVLPTLQQSILESPDLNSIKHLWDDLEQRLRSRPARPTSIAELILCVAGGMGTNSTLCHCKLVESFRKGIDTGGDPDQKRTYQMLE
ncbi:hypothetical protein RF55_10965 [Lasius niger]|uniref:Uncharacterized protein n=1 Tax=Lasius niger TaxID=67767 RepID=A0A0J7KG54_LASNI|nr:hypothetical protein RF55_10965 [Lasius niger]